VLNREEHVPLYYQIKQILISRIVQMNPGDLFTSENALMQEFNVSRGTIKQAITELVQEGLIHRIQGKGTFVSSPKIERSFDSLPSFSAEIRQKGYNPRYQILEFNYEEPSEKIRHLLKVPPYAGTWKLMRTILADEEPIAYVTSYLRSDVYQDLDKHQMSESLYETLRRIYNKVPVAAEDVYQVEKASSSLSNLLAIPKGSPVIYSERVASLDNGIPVEYVESYVRSDRFILKISITGAVKEPVLSVNGGKNDGNASGIRSGNILG